MPAPYSNDLRQKVISAWEQQEKPNQRQIADRFGVSYSSVKRLTKQYRATGSVLPGQMGGHVKPKVSEEGAEAIKTWLAADADLTLAELCERYQDTFGVQMSTSAMDRGLNRARITRKKKCL